MIEFREERLSLIEEADGDNIGVNDLICMMLQIGSGITERELGSIKNPTLIAFNDKIEGYEQARKTVSSSAFGSPLRVAQDAIKILQPLRPRNVRRNLVKMKRGADVSHCAESVLDVRMTTTCSHSARIQHW